MWYDLHIVAQTKTPRERKPKKQRRKHIWISLLNIKAEPHEAGAEDYKKLWLAAADLAETVKFHGDKVARIGSAETKLLGVEEAIGGVIWTYTKVGGKGGVLNVKEKRMLKPEEFRLIQFNWDEHGFNPRVFHYIFLPQDHRLGFEWAGGLSPRFLKWIIHSILNSPTVLAKSGIRSVDVEIEQDKSALDQIFALNLSQLTVVLTKPNPDDTAGFPERFRKSLAEQNAQDQTLILPSVPGSRLNPNEFTKQISTLALSDGSVEGRGKDPVTDRVKTLQTQASPIRVGNEWDPNVESRYQHIFRVASVTVAGILKRMKCDDDDQPKA